MFCLLGGKTSLLLLSEPRFLCGRRLLLFDLLGFLRGNAGFFCRLCRRCGPDLLGLLRTLGGKPELLLLGQSRFLCCGRAGFFGCDFLQLNFCQVGIEALGIGLKKCLPRVPVADLQRQFIVAPDRGLRIGLRTRCNRLCRHQRHVIAAKRAVDVRLLLVAGVLQDLVADKTEGAPEIEAGFW